MTPTPELLDRLAGLSHADGIWIFSPTAKEDVDAAILTIQRLTQENITLKRMLKRK